MKFNRIQINPKTTQNNRRIERLFNGVIRRVDGTRTRLHMGGRKAPYNDSSYEFIGGPSDRLRKRHYDKSLRHLWKAEEHAPWSSFQDCTKKERQLLEMANQSLNAEEKQFVDQMRTENYKALINKEYTQEQKQAIVNVLSMIGHGEAYAWLVSAEVLNEVKSTGARAALTMQVLEEAKHFVVLRELIQAFDCPIPRLCIWEYILLERTFKSKGLEKFFGMNVVVESFALSLFGMLSHLPGLEILRLFHLDESRHTALPKNYFEEFPMTYWQSRSPRAQLHRLSLVLPALPVLSWIEADLAELGIDAFEFGGSMARKIMVLSNRVGFKVGVTPAQFEALLDFLFNLYCSQSRPNHVKRKFMKAETTKGEHELAIERDIFDAGPTKSRSGRSAQTQAQAVQGLA